MPGLYLITGASRGLGRAMAEALHGQGHRVVGLSRQQAPVAFEQWPCDLVDPLPVARRLEAWLQALDPKGLESATLINNAAVITEPQWLGDADAASLSQAVRVGLEAPLLLSSAFLRATQAWPLKRRLLHISSGLGRRGLGGASPYCAVKAGLDNLARAQADEESTRANGARVCSLAPGVIDTDMQSQLRNASPTAFAGREAFVALHRDGRLDSPERAAARVIARLHREDFGQAPVADVREA